MTISLMYSLAHSFVEALVFITKKWLKLVTLCTITQIELWYLGVWRKPVIKSIFITFHFHVGILIYLSHFCRLMFHHNLRQLWNFSQNVYYILIMPFHEKISQIMVHLSRTWMKGIPRFMGFYKDLLPQLTLLRNT